MNKADMEYVTRIFDATVAWGVQRATRKFHLVWWQVWGLRVGVSAVTYLALNTVFHLLGIEATE